MGRFNIFGVALGVFGASASLTGRAQQPPPRDAASQRVGAGSISGRVLADETGAAVRNARVQATFDGGSQPPTFSDSLPPVFTDADGTFVVPSLAPGRYHLVAAKAGYITTDFGAERFRDVGTAIDVVAGAVAGTIELRLPRAAALSGRIVDSLGDPVIGMIVGAEIPARGGDAQTITVATAETDDRGEYRLSGLPAGRFFVSVHVVARVGGVSVLGLEPTRFENRQHAFDDLLREMAANGRDIDVDALSARTYYPGTPNLSQAQSIAIGPGEERAAIDLLVPARAPRTVEAILGGLSGGRGGTGPAGVGSKGTIRGRIVTADGLPVVQALVQLRSDDNSGILPTAITDMDGRYELQGLSAGTYTVIASKAGFISVAFGQRRAFGPGEPIEVGPREVRDRADIVLPRPGAISGQILDEGGDPVEGADVRVLQVRFEGGRRQLVDVDGVVERRTDDRGHYRLYGLQPGEYIVSALAKQAFGQTTVDLPGYALTYFPGRSAPTEARLVAVDLSQQVPNVDFALARVQTARVSGTVLDAAGNPVRGILTLSQTRRLELTAAMPASRTARSDGTFDFTNVPPGDYVLQASKSRDNSFDGAYNEAEFASRFVTVTGTDITDLVVRLSTGSTVKGHITIETRGGEPPGWAVIDLSARPVDIDRSPIVGSSPASARIREDWTFEMTGLSGPRLFRVMHSSPGWTLKAVLLNGRDVTDTPLDFGRRDQSLDDLEVVLTDRGSELSGRVANERGGAVADFTVIVFARDREQWTLASRFLTAAKPEPNRTFRVRGLPAGEYLVAAVDRIIEGEWQDPTFLESLVPDATRISLTEAQTASIGLRLIVR